MRGHPQLFTQLESLFVRYDKVALIAKFGDSIGNCVVQATVKRSKLVCLKWRVALEREIRNRLAQVAIIMDDLVNR